MASGTAGTARSWEIEDEPSNGGGGPESSLTRSACLSTVSTGDHSIDGVGTAAIGSGPVIVSTRKGVSAIRTRAAAQLSKSFLLRARLAVRVQRESRHALAVYPDQLA
jgi:hypothetical protein